MVVSLTNAVNHPIELTEPSLGVVNWRSMGGGDGFHTVCTLFELLQGRTALAEVSRAETNCTRRRAEQTRPIEGIGRGLMRVVLPGA